MQEKLNKDYIFWILSIFFSTLAAYFVFRSTASGAGLTPDSVAYVSGARGILENKNLDGLNTLWPPLYPIFIAMGGAVTGDVLLSARWLQIGFAFLNTTLLGYVIYQETNRTLYLTLAGWLIFISSTIVIIIHSMAWSEASFLLFALSGFYFLSKYIGSRDRYFHLLLGAFFVGLAFITRYMGGTLIASGVLCIVFLSKRSAKKRILDCIVFGVISSIFMIVWLTYIYSGQDSLKREVIFSPIGKEKIIQGVHILQNIFFVPGNYEYFLLILILFPVILYFIYVKYSKKEKNASFLETSFIFILVYLFLLYIAMSFVDSSVILDERILFPPLLFYLIWMLLLTGRILSIIDNNILKIVVIVSVFVFSYHHFVLSQNRIDHVAANGIGYANKKWAQSDILAWVRKLPGNQVIYTNGPDPINIYLNRSSKIIPRHTFSQTRQPNYNIMKELKQMANDLIENDGYIVYFNAVNWRWYLPTVDQLKKKFTLQEVYSGRDGIVLAIEDKPL